MVKIKYFHDPNCVPCEEMKPVITKLRRAHPSWNIKTINTETEKGSKLSDRNKVTFTPTLIIEKSNRKVKIVGVANKEKIEKVVKKI